MSAMNQDLRRKMKFVSALYHLDVILDEGDWYDLVRSIVIGLNISDFTTNITAFTPEANYFDRGEKLTGDNEKYRDYIMLQGSLILAKEGVDSGDSYDDLLTLFEDFTLYFYNYMVTAVKSIDSDSQLLVSEHALNLVTDAIIETEWYEEDVTKENVHYFLREVAKEYPFGLAVFGSFSEGYADRLSSVDIFVVSPDFETGLSKDELDEMFDSLEERLTSDLGRSVNLVSQTDDYAVRQMAGVTVISDLEDVRRSLKRGDIRTSVAKSASDVKDLENEEEGKTIIEKVTDFTETIAGGAVVLGLVAAMIFLFVSMFTDLIPAGDGEGVQTGEVALVSYAWDDSVKWSDRGNFFDSGTEELYVIGVYKNDEGHEIDLSDKPTQVEGFMIFMSDKPTTELRYSTHTKYIANIGDTLLVSRDKDYFFVFEGVDYEKEIVTLKRVTADEARLTKVVHGTKP